MTSYNAIIIGGGPAGLAAALAAANKGAKVLIIEREVRLGGILKQCVHDGFGVLRYGEKLSGCEYAQRFINEAKSHKNITTKLQTFVIDIQKRGKFFVTTTSSTGIEALECDNLVLANGCRERTAKQVNIHGTRPSGVMSAGVAQNYVNLQGVLPTKRCVILGSGDIGLIMARRLTLEGAEVVGVYEAKSTPSGLTRNISQCLTDFGIPLHLSHTVKRVFGNNRVEAVEVCAVNEKMEYIDGTEEIIPCDALILSVGLIPENELAESLKIAIDPHTKGPYVDQNMMTCLDGVYSVGNALHVHDLVDYVSETAEIAGNALAANMGGAGKDAESNSKESNGTGSNDTGSNNATRDLLDIEHKGFLYLVPQKLDLNSLQKKTAFYFRTACVRNAAKLTVSIDGEAVYTKKFTYLKPPEMEKIELPIAPKKGQRVLFCLETLEDK